jgi:hypothetical protein
VIRIPTPIWLVPWGVFLGFDVTLPGFGFRRWVLCICKGRCLLKTGFDGRVFDGNYAEFFFLFLGVLVVTSFAGLIDSLREEKSCGFLTTSFAG